MDPQFRACGGEVECVVSVFAAVRFGSNVPPGVIAILPDLDVVVDARLTLLDINLAESHTDVLAVGSLDAPNTGLLLGVGFGVVG